MPPESAEVKRWLEKADRDVRTARAVLDQQPPITDTAAFHCQQAAEKLLKAYLVFKCVDFEFTHDLRALVEACAEYDSDFLQLRDSVAPLTAYAVRFRYPGPADPTTAEILAALKVVDEIQDFVHTRLPQVTHP